MFCFTLFEAIYSQNGKATILFKDGTSIEGYGDIEKGKIRFRITKDEEPDIWDHTIVSGIIFGKLDVFKEFEYVTYQVGRKPELLRVVKDGEIRLYERQKWKKKRKKRRKRKRKKVRSLGPGNLFMVSANSEEISRKTYYIKRKDEPRAHDFNLNIKNALILYFQNCDVIRDILLTKEYKKLTQPQIVDLYNLFCTD